MGKKKKKKKGMVGGDIGCGGGGGAEGARTATQVEAQVLGGNCAQLCPSLLLHIGGGSDASTSLLFNAGCEFVRHAGEDNVKLKKLSHVFLAEPSVDMGANVLSSDMALSVSRQ
eukprot:SAG11_NODE_9_length_28972_cov_81.532539_14_plen_114_part_00